MDLAFEWDEEKANRNEAKHGVTFEEAKTIFNDPFAMTIPDPNHSDEEERWLDIGLSAEGRLLAVCILSEAKEYESSVPAEPRKRKRGHTHMSEPDHDTDEMREEYDFSQGVRGKHYRAYRAGHVVRVRKPDGSVEECHFTLQDGAVMLDPDLKVQFPDSESVNRALRSLVAQG